MTETTSWPLHLIATSYADAERQLEELELEARALMLRSDAVQQGKAKAVAAIFAERASLSARAGALGAYPELERLVAGAEAGPRIYADALLAEINAHLTAPLHYWMEIKPKRRQRLVSEPELRPYRLFLERVEESVALLLHPDAEAALAAREEAANDAWQRLYGDLFTALEVQMDLGDGEKTYPFSQTREMLRRQDAGLRDQAGQAMLNALTGTAPLFARCLDALAADRLAVVELHDFESPLAVSAWENQVSVVEIEQLLSLVGSNNLGARLLKQKSGELGRDFRLVDRFASVAPSWQLSPIAAAELVQAAFANFAPFSPLGQEVERLFAEGRVDLVERDGKKPLMACLSAAEAGPFVHVGSLDSFDDLIDLAHEVGHALQATRSFKVQGPDLAEPTGFVGEVAAAIAEAIVWNYLEEALPDEAPQLRAQRLGRAFELAWLQAAVARFEIALYQRRRAGQELEPDGLGELWLEVSAPAYGPNVAASAEWPLFRAQLIDAPGSAWTYAGATLLAAAFMARADPRRAEDLLTLLDGGSTVSGHAAALLAGFANLEAAWRAGLAALEQLAA